MIFKDKEIMEKLDRLEEMIKDLKSQVADLTYCVDKIMIEFDIGEEKADQIETKNEKNVEYIEPPADFDWRANEDAIRRWCGGEEIWERYYRGEFPTSIEVSNHGNVRSARTGRPLKIYKNRGGKPIFHYQYMDGDVKKASTSLVCNAVVSTFLDPMLELKCHSVRHIDENVNNNHVDNLVVH